MTTLLSNVLSLPLFFFAMFNINASLLGVFVIKLKLLRSTWISFIDAVTCFIFVATLFNWTVLKVMTMLCLFFWDIVPKKNQQNTWQYLYVPAYLRVWVLIAKLEDVFILINHTFYGIFV